jgi:hypothetical protein
MMAAVTPQDAMLVRVELGVTAAVVAFLSEAPQVTSEGANHR